MTAALQRTGSVVVAGIMMAAAHLMPVPVLLLSVCLLAAAVYIAGGYGRQSWWSAAMIVLVVPVIYNPPGLSPLELLYYGGAAVFILHSFTQALAGKVALVGSIDRSWLLIVLFLGIGTLLGLYLNRSAKVLMDLGYFYSPILLYAGIVALLRKPVGPKPVVVAMALVVGFVALHSLIMYRQALVRVVEEWQFNFVRATGNENVLLLGAMASLAGIVVMSGWRWKLPFIAFAALTWAALYLTYTRSLWGAAIVGSGMMFLMFQDRNKWWLMAQLGLSVVLLLSIGAALYPEAVGLVWKVTLARFEGFQGSAIDLSLEERIHETKAVWNAILANPIVGHGLSTPYLHYDILKGYSSSFIAYIHNGYLAAWYTFGLFGLLAILWYVGAVFGSALRQRMDEQLMNRVIAYATIGYISGAMVMNIAAPVFSSFEGWFVLVVLGAWQSQFATRRQA